MARLITVTENGIEYKAAYSIIEGAVHVTLPDGSIHIDVINDYPAELMAESLLKAYAQSKSP